MIGKGVYGLVLTFILLGVARATLQDWAAIGTIIAAIATAGYTSYKWTKEMLADLRSGKKKISFKKKR